MMIRKQLYLPEDLNRRLAVTAKQQRKPEAEVIRNLLHTGLTQQIPTQTAGGALLGLAKLGKELGLAGPTDLSSRIDDILYGTDIQ